MIGIITEFGKRVSTRWVTAILLPGSLWVIVFGIAVVLGHGSPFDLARLVAETEALGDEFVRHPGRAVVAVGLAVAGAGVAGTVADRKSTRLNSRSREKLVCLLLLEK